MPDSMSRGAARCQRTNQIYARVDEALLDCVQEKVRWIVLNSAADQIRTVGILKSQGIVANEKETQLPMS